MNNSIIKVGNESYHKNVLCNDDRVITLLKNQQKLNPDVRYNLICTSDHSYTAKSFLGKGQYNYVYSIKEDPTKVLRITIPGSNIITIFEEINGLFLQSYMSKSIAEGGIACPNICKVYEFGNYRVI